MPVRALSQLVVFPAVLTAACGASARTAEQSGSGGANVAATTAEGSESSEPSEAEATPSAARPRLNLLGDVNTELGEGRRNKNVRLTLIDHSVLREINRACFAPLVANGSWSCSHEQGAGRAERRPGRETRNGAGSPEP